MKSSFERRIPHLGFKDYVYENDLTADERILNSQSSPKMPIGYVFTDLLHGEIEKYCYQKIIPQKNKKTTLPKKSGFVGYVGFWWLYWLNRRL
jgi:hypothetical protein